MLVLTLFACYKSNKLDNAKYSTGFLLNSLLCLIINRLFYYRMKMRFDFLLCVMFNGLFIPCVFPIARVVDYFSRLMIYFDLLSFIDF